MGLGSFQKIILGIALIVLIIILAFVGMAVSSAKQNYQWPPLVPECPDYWLMDGSGNNTKCINVKDLGKCTNPAGSTSEHLIMDFNQAPYNGSNGTCAKYQWATRCGISWDGITYGVVNPCEASSTANS